MLPWALHPSATMLSSTLQTKCRLGVSVRLSTHKEAKLLRNMMGTITCSSLGQD